MTDICHICKDTGFFITEDGKEAVCLECQHIDWSAKNSLTNRGNCEHRTGVRCSHSRPTNSIPTVGYKGYNIAESINRRDLSDNKPNPVLPIQENVRLDSSESDRCPHCGVYPFVQEQMHGHYVCMNCYAIIVGCCDGERG